ncbi:MAG TPA: hypothetical protein VF657_16180 [Actinoplanes sp.]|jgi:hypothetical protein
MSIIPVSPPQTEHCPTWCAGHLATDDDAFTHLSAERTVQTTAGGPAEHGEIYVCVERFDRPSNRGDIPTVRLGDQPMSPIEALELAVALRDAACDALSSAAVGSEQSDTDWARQYLAQETDSDDERRIQRIVADLLQQIGAPQ